MRDVRLGWFVGVRGNAGRRTYCWVVAVPWGHVAPVREPEGRAQVLAVVVVIERDRVPL